MEEIQESLGRVELVVLDAVLNELQSLSQNSSPKLAKYAKSALNFAAGLKKISFDEGENVDDKIINCAVSRNASVATLDSGLRQRLKVVGVIVVFRRGNLLTVAKS
jgi:rRNA-processing protein FCF1|tara:strand:+ start:5792 stop:6109 length:318 start_codon:yes stop_codon:yes gene_type:complete